MSTDDAAACRQLIEDQVRTFVTTRIASQETPISDVECSSLIESIQTVWSRIERPPWNSGLAPTDTALRSLTLDLISTLSINDADFVQVWYLIDVATIIANNDLCDPASNFQLVETLLDSQTVSGCRRVFDYLESRRDRLIEKNFDKKNLAILRSCNELLRRLSRAEDTVFCGRVFIFLFQSFPLGDRSSVNLRGEFHTENVTHFDPAPKRSDDAIKPMEIDTDKVRPTSSGGQTPLSTVADADHSQKGGRGTPLPRMKGEAKSQETPPDLDALFPQFWSLQKLFSQPTRLFEPASMTEFKQGIDATLACFKSIATSTSTTSTTTDLVKGTKRKHSEMEGSTRVAQPYNPKYLTNRDLFDLEIHDLAFRRHILAQCLIMIDFMLSLSTSAKVKTQGTGNNKAVLYSYTLSEEDAKYCQSTRQSIAGYLQQQGPGNDGKSYYRMVDTVLTRDKNWAKWKAESCLPISRPAVDVETFVTTQKALKDVTDRKTFINPPGANDFSFLSHSEPLEALKHPNKRHRIPSLEDYYKSIEGDKLDEDFAVTDEEKKDLQERIQGKLWRALRASALSGRRFELCEKIKDGTNLKALIGQDEESVKEQAQPEETNLNGTATDDAKDAVESKPAPPSGATPIPQLDGAADVPDTDAEIKDERDGDAEAIAVPDAAPTPGDPTDDEGDDEDDEFAPPGAMDVDDVDESGKGSMAVEVGAAATGEEATTDERQTVAIDSMT